MENGKLLLLLLGAFVLVASPVHGDEEVDEKDVVVLTSDFDEKVVAYDFILVEFYAPWCGHCKQLKPQYAKAATALKDAGVTNVRLAKIDCDEWKDVCTKNGVQGYPTLKWFPRGAKPIDFEGPRTAEGIVEFANNYMKPALTDLATKEEAEKFQKSGGVVLIAYTSDDALRKVVEQAAEILRSDVKFGIASPEFSPTGSASLYAYLSFADEPVAFEGEFSTVEDITKFVQRESFPLVQEITPENYKRCLARELPLVWCFLKEDERDANIEVLRVAAAESKGSLTWVYLDADTYVAHANNMGIFEYPGIMVHNISSNTKYKYEGKFEGDALREWAVKVLSGTTDPFSLSEPIPESNDGPMTQVVGNNFDDIVLDKSKDVLLEVYSPSCGFCVQFEPIYKSISEVFADDSSVIISKADGKSNDLPLDIKGFPSVFFFPAGDKDKPISYEGERSVDAVVAFVSKNSKTLSEDRKKSIVESTKASEEGDDEDENERDEL